MLIRRFTAAFAGSSTGCSGILIFRRQPKPLAVTRTLSTKPLTPSASREDWQQFSNLVKQIDFAKSLENYRKHKTTHKASTLIATFRRRGDLQSAVGVYQELVAANIAPSPAVLRALLVALLSAPATLLEQRQLIESMAANVSKWQIKLDDGLGQALLDALWKCDSEAQAKKLFSWLNNSGGAGLLTFSAMINGLARAGKVDEAMAELEDGTARGIRWDDRALCAVLVACGKAGSLSHGQRVHEIAVAHNAAQGRHYFTSLLDMYARCGEVQQAKAVFDKLKASGELDTHSCTAMINGLARAGKIEEAWKLLEDGNARGFRWDDRAFCALLVACGERKALDVGRGVHKLAVTHNAARGLEYWSSLLDMYTLCGEQLEAAAVFDIMRNIDQQAAFSAKISSLSRAGNVEAAMSTLEDGTARGIHWNERSFCALLAACGKAGYLAYGQRVHDIAVAHGAAHGKHYLTSLLDMYARCGEMQQAAAAFDKLKQSGLASTVSYSAFISGLARVGEVDAAVRVLEEGNTHGLRWNDRVFGPLLVACGESGALAVGKRVHEIAVAHNAAKGKHYQTSLLDMYARCGEVQQARAVLDELKRSGAADVHCYTSMINGLATARLQDDAFAVFDEMLKAGVSPNNLTLTSLLTGCAHGGKEYLAKAWSLIKQVQEQGLQLDQFSHNAMVDVLARNGLLSEAEDYMNTHAPRSAAAHSIVIAAQRLAAASTTRAAG